MKSKFYLAFEYVLLFFAIPLVLFLYPEIVSRPVAFLMPILVLIFFYLKRSPEFSYKELAQLNVSPKVWMINLWIMLVVALLMILAVWIFEPENLFNLPSMNFRLWLMLCFFYPVFSATIQEIIFKTFFFRRYKKIFPGNKIMIMGSGIAFSFIHIVYYSWVSMTLTFILGIYLAYLYQKTRSVLFVTILHGIFGVMAFSFGLGQYFWLDMFAYINEF